MSAATVDYRGRVAIVTGASSGIGRQVALDLAARGAAVVLSARRREQLEQVAAECAARGGVAEALVGDVAERAFVEGMAARAVERFGRIDVVVNNAGVSKHKQIYHLTADEVDYVVRVNFLAPAFLTLAALPAMLRRGEGWVVNISSAAGKLPPPRESVYAASKFALTGFTEGLWLDLAGSGIHAAVIHVGPIDTEIWHKTDEPTAYRGRKLPASAVSAAVFRAIERRRHEVWVPGSLRLAWWLRLLAPGLFRWGAGRFDPVPPAVIAEARARARRKPGLTARSARRYILAMDPHGIAEARSLAYHRAIAGRLAGEPALVERARARVREWLQARPEARFARGWADVLGRPTPDIAAVLTDPGERARELRQSTPFAGALDPRERWRLWREVGEQLRAST